MLTTTDIIPDGDIAIEIVIALTNRYQMDSLIVCIAEKQVNSAQRKPSGKQLNYSRSYYLLQLLLSANL